MRNLLILIILLIQLHLWGSQLTINQSIAGSSSLTKLYPLDGYNINLTGLNGNKVNTLVQTYTISTDPSWSSKILYNLDKV
jgi:hypothetical protein